jgi:hypothetical protein
MKVKAAEQAVEAPQTAARSLTARRYADDGRMKKVASFLAAALVITSGAVIRADESADLVVARNWLADRRDAGVFLEGGRVGEAFTRLTEGGGEILEQSVIDHLLADFGAFFG